MTIPIRRYLDLLASYLLPQWRRVVLLFVLLSGSIGLQLVNPLLLRSFIDTALAGGAVESLWRTALLFTGLALAQQVVSVAHVYVGELVGWIATNRLREDLTRHCLRLDMAFHHHHTPGELIERIDGDVEALSAFFSSFVVYLLGNALLLVGILVVLLRINGWIALGMALFTALTLLVMHRNRDRAAPSWKADRQIFADMLGFLEERLGGLEDIQTSGAQGHVTRRLYEWQRARVAPAIRAQVLTAVLLGVTWTLFGLGHAVGLGLGASLLQSGLISLGTVYLVYTYTEMLRRPLHQLSETVADLQRASASIVRIDELYHTQPAVQDGPGVPLPLGPLAVEFDRVSFSYDKREAGPALSHTGDEVTSPDAGYILQNISFHLPPGRTLGLLGRTGSGKTTLTRLLFRLYDSSEGAVRLSGVNLRDTHLADLRDRIGLVTQDVQLFHASVRDNLTLFDPTLPDARLVAALEEVGLTNWYGALPHGLDTRLQSGGGGLSAGQAQLLALTRVFLRDPGLVIFDEASSRLDPATERLMERALDRLLQGRTAIIIAHRLRTVQRADEIIILDQGRIQEYGERGALARDPASRFSHLLQVGLEEVLV